MSEGTRPVHDLAAVRRSRDRGRHRAIGRRGRGSRAQPHQRARFRGQERASQAERTIAAFLHAARLGIFELSWNVLCPGCGGVLDTGATLKTVDRSEYSCALCAAGYEPTLDEMVEVTFTVSPRVRRIAAHDPDRLPLAGVFSPGLLGFGHRSARGFRATDRRDHARGRRAAARREGHPVAAVAGGVRDRLRPGDALDPVPRRAGRGDP